MHSRFISPNKAPLGGFWVALPTNAGTVRVPETNGADHFDHLVNLVAAQLHNTNTQIPDSVRDHTANLICLRDTGFCNMKLSSSPSLLGNVSAVTKTKRRTCGSCGGRRTK